MTELSLLPSGQILRGAGDPDSVLASCTVAHTRGRELQEIANEVFVTTRMGVGVGLNISRLPQRLNGTRANWLGTVVRRIASAQEANAATGIARTATGVVLDWADALLAPDLAKLLASHPRYRHLTLSVRVPSAAIAPEATDSSRCKLNQIANAAIQFGMPGVILQDNVAASARYLDEPEAANPCVEQHLAPDETCILATINLATIWADSDDIDAWHKLDYLIRLGVRFLSDAIDASRFMSPRAEALAKERRRVGLGVTGFASALDSLGVPYESSAAVGLAQRIGAALVQASKSEADALRRRDRCAADSYLFMTSIPPSGAVAKLAGVQPGIGPTRSTPQTLELARHYIEVVSTFQGFIDNGISVTVPLPRQANAGIVADLLAQAEAGGCKGVTFFRDGTTLSSFASSN